MKGSLLCVFAAVLASASADVTDTITELTTLIQTRVNDEVMTAAASGINTVEGLSGVVTNCLSTLSPELLELSSLKSSLGETLDVSTLVSLTPNVLSSVTNVLSGVTGTVTGLTSALGLGGLLGGSCTSGTSSLLSGITDAATSMVGSILSGVTSSAAVC